MNNYAPILIPTLNRYSHFKRCIESLADCTHAKKTNLYIALDYPLKENHWEGYIKIENYIAEIKGFNKIIVIKRSENYGAVKNYIDGCNTVFKYHETIIFTEDDNEFSPNFLEYINKGLERFKDDNSIFAICGYNYPITIPTNYNFNYFYINAFSAWGYGTWKNRHNEFIKEFSYNNVQNKMKSLKYIFILFFKETRIIDSLLKIIKTKYLTADTVITANLITRGMYCVFPTITKVKNNGHDGSGVNCGKLINNNIYLTQELDINHKFIFENESNIKNITSINNVIYAFFNINFSAKLRILIKYLIYRMTNNVPTRINNTRSSSF